MIRICGPCAAVIYTNSAISILQDIYPQRTFLTAKTLIG
jgi:hypothetical protein